MPRIPTTAATPDLPLLRYATCSTRDARASDGADPPEAVVLGAVAPAPLDPPPSREREAAAAGAAARQAVFEMPRGVRRGMRTVEAPANWSFETFAGRFTEVSGDRSGAPLSLVFRLVLEVQRRGEPAAWIGRADTHFYPPDVAASGVDLEALPVVRAHDVASAAGAADLLVRSGAFSLVILDLGAQDRLSLPAQTRLVGLAKQHDAAVVCLTDKPEDRPSVGSLVSLRAHAARVEREGDRFRCEARVLKDKRRGPGWRHAEVLRGPDGVR